MDVEPRTNPTPGDGHLADNSLTSSQIRLVIGQAVFDNTTDGVIITDREGSIVSVNGSFTAITGYSREESIGRNPRFLQSGSHNSKFYEQMWDSLKIIGQWQGEIQNRRKDGTIYPEFLNIISVKDGSGSVIYYIGLFTDLTTRKDTEEFFKHVATHDPLTNLPNRTRFYDCLNNAIYEAKLNHRNLAVLFIDLDGFKAVNDTYGHDAGDLLLLAVSERLLGSVTPADTVSRMGGDEFTIILGDLHDRQDAVRLAETTLAALGKPFVLDHITTQITASIGISLYPGDGENAESLLLCADRAMYQVKDTGKNGFRFFSRFAPSS